MVDLLGDYNLFLITVSQEQDYNGNLHWLLELIIIHSKFTIGTDVYVPAIHTAHSDAYVMMD